ncbi:MAG: LPS export ABC transporter permease LptF [Pseudomonadales bacterium]
MILFRYLVKEVLQATTAVTFILLLIVTSGRLAKYLAQSSSGDLSSDVVFSVILFRIPDFLPLILPLGFFIGLLLAYGRLYVDNEMIVINACGTGKKRLVTITAIPALLMSMLVAYLTLLGAPASLNKVQSILQDPANTNSLAILQEGKFQETSGGQRVIYAEQFDPENDAINGVWMVEHRGDGSVMIVRADSGRINDNAQLDSQYLTLENGAVYDGFVGRRDYQITEFQSYAQKVVERRQVEKLQLEGDAKSTYALFISEQPGDVAALHWRFSLPVVVLVVALLALALSKTNQRSGRYIKMLPAILIYLLYIVSITGVRNMIETESQPPITIWLVHALFFAGAVVLLLKDDFSRIAAARRSLLVN